MGYQKNKRPDFQAGERNSVLTQSSTQLNVAGAPVLKIPQAWSLSSTSTAAPAYFLVDSPRGGEIVAACVGTLASSSNSPLKLKTRAGETYDGTNDVAALSTAGAGIQIQALSTSRWGIIGQFGVTLSTST